MFKRILFILSMTVTVIGLSACAGFAPAPTATPSPITPAPSATPQPTATAIATATTTATLPPTLTPTLTASPTPAAGFAAAQVISVYKNAFGISLVIKISNLTLPYTVKLNEKEYRCVIDKQTPDRLFCQGLAIPQLDQEISFQFIDPQSSQVVYDGNTVVSSLFAPSDLPNAYTNTNCPNRGKNVRCEQECRLTSTGSPCVVATCYDACGLYFSVNTCPASMTQPFNYCDISQYPDLKKKYNLP